MEQIHRIKCEGNDKPVRINEGQEKGNNRNVNTPRPNVQPAPQPKPKEATKNS